MLPQRQPRRLVLPLTVLHRSVARRQDRLWWHLVAVRSRLLLLRPMLHRQQEDPRRHRLLLVMRRRLEQDRATRATTRLQVEEQRGALVALLVAALLRALLQALLQAPRVVQARVVHR